MNTTNRLTIEEWAALLREVAEFPGADAATLTDAAIGCPDEIKLQVWRSLDTETRDRLQKLNPKKTVPQKVIPPCSIPAVKPSLPPRVAHKIIGS